MPESSPTGRQLKRAPRRERTAGSFTLGAPGTYVSEEAGALIVGVRPGIVHYVIAFGVPAACLALTWFLLYDVWWMGVGALLLFGVPSFLILLNSQRFEVRPGEVAMRGRALGFRVQRTWRLPADAAVRLGTRWEMNLDSSDPYRWTYHQAQLSTDDGWIAIAESARPGPALDFARRLASAARVPLLEAPEELS